MRSLLYQFLFVLIIYVCHQTGAYSLLLFSLLFILLSEALEPYPRDSFLRKITQKRYYQTFGYSNEEKDDLIKKFLISKVKTPYQWQRMVDHNPDLFFYSSDVIIATIKVLTHEELYSLMKRTPYSYDKVFYWCFIHNEPYFLKPHYFSHKGCEIYYEIKDHHWNKFIGLIFKDPKILPLLDSVEFALFLKTGKIYDKDKYL